MLNFISSRLFPSFTKPVWPAEWETERLTKDVFRPRFCIPAYYNCIPVLQEKSVGEPILGEGSPTSGPLHQEVTKEFCSPNVLLAVLLQTYEEKSRHSVNEVSRTLKVPECSATRNVVMPRDTIAVGMHPFENPKFSVVEETRISEKPKSVTREELRVLEKVRFTDSEGPRVVDRSRNAVPGETKILESMYTMTAFQDIFTKDSRINEPDTMGSFSFSDLFSFGSPLIEEKVPSISQKGKNADFGQSSKDIKNNNTQTSKASSNFVASSCSTSQAQKQTENNFVEASTEEKIEEVEDCMFLMEL